MKEPKYLKTSLLSGLLTMLPAVIFFVFAIVNGSSILANGEVDNDPMSAGWGLLFLSPVIYVVLSTFYYSISRLLAWLGKLNIQYLEIFVFVVSALLAYSIAYDNLIMFFITFIVFSIWLSIGSITWFYFGILPHNKSLNLTGEKNALPSYLKRDE